MVGFSTKTFEKHDDYMTPRYAWENIKQYIPKNKTIWEAFYGDGTSGEILKDLGFEVIHKNIDFFENNLGNIIVSNCPFSIKKNVFTRLKKLDKPFIIIAPSAMIHTKYIKELFGKSKESLKIIIPRKRIQFIKFKNGKKVHDQKNKCNFDCFYYCYKIQNLKNGITWL
jgi:hypothetical protein